MLRPVPQTDNKKICSKEAIVVRGARVVRAAMLKLGLSKVSSSEKRVISELTPPETPLPTPPATPWGTASEISWPTASETSTRVPSDEQSLSPTSSSDSLNVEEARESGLREFEIFMKMHEKDSERKFGENEEGLRIFEKFMLLKDAESDLNLGDT